MSASQHAKEADLERPQAVRVLPRDIPEKEDGETVKGRGCQGLGGWWGVGGMTRRNTEDF